MYLRNCTVVIRYRDTYRRPRYPIVRRHISKYKMKQQLESCLFCSSKSIVYTNIPFCSDNGREQYHEERLKSLHRMTAGRQ